VLSREMELPGRKALERQKHLLLDVQRVQRRWGAAATGGGGHLRRHVEKLPRSIRARYSYLPAVTDSCRSDRLKAQKERTRPRAQENPRAREQPPAMTPPQEWPQAHGL
jgi:hypothetical protein